MRRLLRVLRRRLGLRRRAPFIGPLWPIQRQIEPLDADLVAQLRRFRG